MKPQSSLNESAGSRDAQTLYARAVELAMEHDNQPSWHSAIEYLEQAANLGHDSAQAQLTLLEGWRNPALWPPIPPLEAVCRAPVILKMSRFLPSDMCDWLIVQAEKLIKPALVYDEETGTGRIDAGRSNSAGYFSGKSGNMIAGLVRRRISSASGVPLIGFEPTQVLSYEVGQVFDWHVDYLDPKSPAYADDLTRRGQRIATCLIYLNDDFTGGETAFHVDKILHRGGVGDALMWSNVLPHGEVDQATSHAGLPLSSGRKWVLSQWIRNQAPRNT